MANKEKRMDIDFKASTKNDKDTVLNTYFMAMQAIDGHEPKWTLARFMTALTHINDPSQKGFSIDLSRGVKEGLMKDLDMSERSFDRYINMMKEYGYLQNGQWPKTFTACERMLTAEEADPKKISFTISSDPQGHAAVNLHLFEKIRGASEQG